MSFILDALNKSEEKRTEKHSQKAEKQVLHPQLPTQKRWPLLIIGILTFTLILICAWWFSQSGETEKNPSLPEIQRTDQTEAVTMPTPSKLVAAEPESVDEQQKKPSFDKQLLSAPVPQQHAPTQKPQRSQTATNKKPPTQLKVHDEVLPFNELAPPLQQEILPLNISLHFFSPDQSRRMLRINGKIRHEKDAVTEQLSIYEIKEKSTIFSYRGRLFELPVPGQ